MNIGPAFLLAAALLLCLPAAGAPPRKRMRDWGLTPGVMHPGAHNAITDVPGVKVGQVTSIEVNNVRTGVTMRSAN